MIAKHVPMKVIAKSDYAELIDYLEDEQEKEQRVGAVRVTNCHTDMVAAAVEEVLAMQLANTLAVSDKTFHLIVSFRAGESPAPEVLAAIEDRICEGLGYGEHQRISVLHTDTDNLHLHIAINKIHPQRRTYHEPYQFHRTLAELCAVMERDYSLEPDNHTRRRSAGEGRAQDMERHSGIESLLTWVRREVMADMQAATSWVDMHQALGAHGLQLRPRGAGMVIVADDGTTVKASTVGREFSKGAMEARYGPFLAREEGASGVAINVGSGIAERHYDKPPIRLRVNTVELYARYKTEQQTQGAARSAGLSAARAKRDRDVKAAQRAYQLKRSGIKLMRSMPAPRQRRALRQNDATNARILYKQASRSYRADMAAIHAAYAKDRAGLYDNHRRRTWADWLRLQAQAGDQEALRALRAREAAIGLQGNTLHGRSRGDPAASVKAVDSVTKKGTIIYRAGLSAVRDDGDRLQVSQEADRAAVGRALQLAAARYGSRIVVDGTAEFKAMAVRAAVDGALAITFSDAGLERRRLVLTHQEITHDEQAANHTGWPDRGRIDRRGPGGDAGRGLDRSAAGGRAAAGRAGAVHAAADAGEPNTRRPARIPPPACRGGLRVLSQLVVVRFASRGEMLLPNDVPGRVEYRGAESDHPLRRPGAVPAPGVDGAGLAATDKYIAEREEKRLKGFDIPIYRRYTAGAGILHFSGLRHVDGEALALLLRDGVVMVRPVDEATARRLSRLKIGEAVTITAGGAIQTTKKGRSR